MNGIDELTNDDWSGGSGSMLNPPLIFVLDRVCDTSTDVPEYVDAPVANKPPVSQPDEESPLAKVLLDVLVSISRLGHEHRVLPSSLFMSSLP